ncbi:hypothetical protein GQ600_12617 [Phytophthora cactorum]|nr:hypothetical protein GQ600_12617 [Phytophthora cactorum]
MKNRRPSQVPVVEKKQPQAGKEHRKEKSKKDKADKKKTARGKKDKRGPSLVAKASNALNDPATEAQDKLLEALATKSTPLSVRISQGLQKRGLAAASAGQRALVGTRSGCLWVAGRLNVKGLLATTFSLMVHSCPSGCVSRHLDPPPYWLLLRVPLWLSVPGPVRVPVGTTLGTAMVTTFRVILPLVFLVEGISHHSFLLDLNGAELLLASFIISAVKTSNLCSPIFFLSLATQCLLAVFLGSELLVQWLQLALALYSLHVMAVTDDEWIGMGDEEDELSCHPVSMHHSIADYNYNHTRPLQVLFPYRRQTSRPSCAGKQERYQATLSPTEVDQLGRLSVLLGLNSPDNVVQDRS